MTVEDRENAEYDTCYFRVIVLQVHIQLTETQVWHRHGPIYTHYVQLQKITKPRSTVNPNKNAILHCCAEAHSKTVCPCAWSVISWPGVQDETSTLPKYICGTSCKTQDQRKKY